MTSARVVTVVGARPQFVKASVVSAAMRQRLGLNECLVHTGQHFDHNMSDLFFSELDIPSPDYHLGISGGSHAQMTGTMMIELERLFLELKPDAVLVFGDTNSTLAGALAAVKLHIPVAHVEAGLRSFNLRMPEEVNRTLTDRISRWLFAPTLAAQAHLVKEGAPHDRVMVVGDVMYDVALRFASKVSATGGMMEKCELEAGRYVLATVHRAENTDDPQRLGSIVEALEMVSQHLPVVWPIHPRTKAALGATAQSGAHNNSRMKMIEPVGYIDMVQLEKCAAVIATDSGGIQKEAFFHQVPCVTLRNETEWVELIDAGWNVLAPPVSARAVCDAIMAAIGSRGAHVQPYGRGDAAQRIADQLRTDLSA